MSESHFQRALFRKDLLIYLEKKACHGHIKNYARVIVYFHVIAIDAERSRFPRNVRVMSGYNSWPLMVSKAFYHRRERLVMLVS